MGNASARPAEKPESRTPSPLTEGKNVSTQIDNADHCQQSTYHHAKPDPSNNLEPDPTSCCPREACPEAPSRS